MSVTINQANYGSAVYGTARYGLFFVTINNGVSATGAIEAPSVGGFEVDITEALNSVSATGSVGTITASGKATTTLTGVRAINSTNPEFGLTLDGTLAEGTVNGSFTTRTVNTTFAGELTLPSSFTQTVPFWEHGGAGIGAWFGVAKISNVYYLRVRAGEGATSVNLLSDDTDVVIANVPISQIPEFDGNTHTVAWDIKPSAAGRIRLWIDGREVINQETSGGAQLEGGSWSGGDSGGWGVGRSSIAGGTTDSGGTQYQAPADRTWSGTIQSRLRFYSNELVSDLTPLVQVNISEALDSVSATATVGTVEARTTEVLTGVSATGGIGTFTISNTVGSNGVVGTTNTPAVQPNVTEIIADGVSASTALGIVDVTSGIRKLIDSVSATGTIGTLTVNIVEILDSVSATGATNTVGIGNSVTLTGVSATGEVGTVEDKPTEILDSVSATGSIGTLAISNTVGLDGTSGTTNTPSLQPNITEIITGVSATASTNDVNIRFGVTQIVDGVSATGAIEPVTVGGFEVDITEIITIGVSATSALGTIQENLTAKPTGVSATSTLGTIVENVVEKLSTQVITGSAGSVGVGVTPTIVGVSATSNVGIIEARTLEVLASVSATGAVGSVQVNPVAGLEGLEATGEIGVLELKPDEVLVSVSGTTAVGTLQVNVKKLLASVSATLDEGTVTATGVAFDFEAVKELYDRNRTVYVEGFTQAASERTVYVQREVRLVYIERFSTSAERRARASKAA